MCFLAWLNWQQPTTYCNIIIFSCSQAEGKALDVSPLSDIFVISSVKILSCVLIFVTSWTAAHYASLSITQRFLYSCLSSQRWHPTTSSSVIPFSSNLHSFPASGSASASILPINIQDWFSLGLTGLISLQSKGLSRVFFNTKV